MNIIYINAPVCEIFINKIVANNEIIYKGIIIQKTDVFVNSRLKVLMLYKCRM